MQKQFERVLAFHCAPTLAGMKPSNLISCTSERFPAIDALIVEYQSALAGSGVCFQMLCRCKRRALILVYREEMLAEQLACPEVSRLLRKAGYPADAPLDTLLDILGTRLSECKEFPHEIGLFLGYPVADVVGFWQNGGRGYQFCGHWKVYADVEQAKERFARYDRVRRALCQKVEAGRSIVNLFSVA